MTRRSTAHEAKQVIIALLQADSRLEGVQVAYGNPVGGLEFEAIFLHDVTWVTERWANAVRTQREERYAIECAITATRDGYTQEEASARAYDLFEVVESVLGGPSVPEGLAALGIYDVEIRPRVEREGTWDNVGRFAAIEVGLEMTARK